MFTKNFNLSENLIDTATKLLKESSKKIDEASNEEPNINHLELSEEELNELSTGTLKSYVKKVASTPAGMAKPSREKGIETASKKLRNEEPNEEVMPKGMSMKERTAFHMAAAAASKAGKSHFEFGGKKFKTTMQKDVAHKMTEEENRIQNIKALVAEKLNEARKAKNADYDDSDEDPEGGSRPSEHIMNQLRKASMTMKREHPVKYSDGKTGMVDRHVAKALVNHYNSLPKAHQKETMQAEIGKSHKHLTNYHNRLQESMYDPNLGKNKQTLVEKKPKKMNEVPIETMKQVKMVHREEAVDTDPNTGKKIHKKVKIHKEEIDENLKVGSMVRVTNPKATPKHKIIGVEGDKYHIEKPDGTKIHLSKERIHKINAIKEEQIDESSPEEIISDFKDRQAYLSHKNQEKQHLNKARITKDTKQQHHYKMADQHNSMANNILDKYNSIKEEQIDESRKSSEASFRVPAHVKMDLEKKHGRAQSIHVSQDGSKITHAVRHLDDDGFDHYEYRTHEYNGKAPIGDRKVGKLIKHTGQRKVNEEQIDEREMTGAEKTKREKIVMALKKKMAGFKERYGERAKDVMYATATKQAMKEEDEAAPKGKTMTGEKKDGVDVKPEMINRGASGVKSTTT
jgi:hypothetical protein